MALQLTLLQMAVMSNHMILRYKSKLSSLLINCQTIIILFRNYFNLDELLLYNGNTFFKQEGFNQEMQPMPLQETDLLKQWKTANTGHFLVDSISTRRSIPLFVPFFFLNCH